VGQGHAQGHALQEFSKSQFKNKPWLLRRLRQRVQTTAGRAWPCSTFPETGKLYDIAHLRVPRRHSTNYGINMTGACQNAAF
jgi:hypothetical protein